MSAELQALAAHCHAMADREKAARPSIAADVAAGALSADHLARHDRTTALWQQLAAEIDTHLNKPTTNHHLEEPLWVTP